MIEINCVGESFEIGLEHGTKAAPQIASTIQFYADLFQKKVKLSWEQACSEAKRFVPHIHQYYPHLESEMQGIAKGAGVTYEEILALNVRSELFFGAALDGCTSLSWETDSTCYLAQNWDWMVEQKPNLVLLQIVQKDKPVIQQVTEAGIIGKIGLNSAGVGLCVNAIRCAGSDVNRTPIHIMWRLVLESPSVDAALEAIKAHGCGGACHMLIADKSRSIGVEVTHQTIKYLQPDEKGRVFHSNHMLESHPGTDMLWVNDSLTRVQRIRELADKLEGEVTQDALQKFLCDEDNYPCSINREQKGESDAASVFSITMDLAKVEAKVLLGRPSKPEKVYVLRPRPIN
ncbi:Isopenicillin-N N-acyltransferase [Exophiala dermatitidis]